MKNKILFSKVIGVSIFLLFSVATLINKFGIYFGAEHKGFDAMFGVAFVVAAVCFLWWLVAVYPALFPGKKKTQQIYLLVLLAVIGLVPRFSIASCNPLFIQENLENSVSKNPAEKNIIMEDAHYYFGIAHNIAVGNGVRHDSFNNTTGFQPLYVFMLVPIFKLIPDKVLAINYIMFFVSMVGLLSGLCIYRLAKLLVDGKAALLIFFLWAVSPYFIRIDLNGLETGMALAAFSFISFYYVKYFKNFVNVSIGRCVCLGVLLGLGVLIRIDMLFLLVAIFIDIFIDRCYSRNGNYAWRNMVLIVVVAFVFYLPWFLYCLFVGHSIMPSGGAAAHILGKSIGMRSLGYLSDGFRFFSLSNAQFALRDTPLFLYYGMMLSAIANIGDIVAQIFTKHIALVVILLPFFHFCFFRFVELKVVLLKVRFMIIFFFFIFIIYSFYILSPWFYWRYFAYFSIFILILWINSIKSYFTNELKDKNTSRMVFAAVIATVLFASLSSGVKLACDMRLNSDPSGYFQMADWINKNTPSDAIVGSPQTGIFGYYLDRKFYGLDGKINTGALEALRKGNIDRYIMENKIQYIADWPWLLESLIARNSVDKDFIKKQELIYAGYYYVYKINYSDKQPY